MLLHGGLPFPLQRGGRLFLLGSLFLCELGHIARRDDAGGQRDDRDAEGGREHGEHAPRRGDGVDVAVAHRGQADGRPVDGLEEGVKGIRLQIEDHERRDQHIGQRERAHGNQRVLRAAEDPADDPHAAGVARDLEHAQDAQRAEHAHETQHLEAAVDGREARQDRQQVDERHKGKGVAHEGQDGGAFVFEVRRCEPGQIVQRKNAGAGLVHGGERRMLALDGERDERDHDQHDHESVVDRAGPVFAARGLDDLKEPFSHVFRLFLLRGSLTPSPPSARRSRGGIP